MIKFFGSKAVQVILGVLRHFFKCFKDQITDTLIFHSIFTSNIKTLHLFKGFIFYRL